MNFLSKAIIGVAFSCSTIAFAEDQKSRISNQRDAAATSQTTSSTSDVSKDKKEARPKWEIVYEDKSMQVYVDVNSARWIDDRVGFWKMIDLYKKLEDGALSIIEADTHGCGKKNTSERFCGSL